MRSVALADEILDRCEVLKAWPGRGRARPEFGYGVRSFPAGPFVVFYHVIQSGHVVEILQVIDGRRDLGTTFFSPISLVIA